MMTRPGRLVGCLLLVAAGCGKGEPSRPAAGSAEAPPGPGVAPPGPAVRPAPVGPAPAAGPKDKGGPIPETPELTALLRKKNWKLLRDDSKYTIPADGPRWVYLQFQHQPSLTPAEWQTLARANAIQMIVAQTVPLTDATLESMAEIKSLECLILNGEKVTDRGLAALAKLPNLKLLYFYMAKFTGEGLAGANGLQGFYCISATAFTDAGAATLAKLPALKACSIQSPTGKLTTAGVRSFATGNMPAILDFPSSLLDDSTLRLLVEKGWLFGPAPKFPVFRDKPATREQVVSVDLSSSRVTGGA
jgi:hypothetical protein